MDKEFNFKKFVNKLFIIVLINYYLIQISVDILCLFMFCTCLAKTEMSFAHTTAFTDILNFDIIIKNIIRMVIYVCNIYNNFR